jgi:hypothetical protein
MHLILLQLRNWQLNFISKVSSHFVNPQLSSCSSSISIRWVYWDHSSNIVFASFSSGISHIHNFMQSLCAAGYYIFHTAVLQNWVFNWNWNQRKTQVILSTLLLQNMSMLYQMKRFVFQLLNAHAPCASNQAEKLPLWGTLQNNNLWCPILFPKHFMSYRLPLPKNPNVEIWFHSGSLNL